MKSRITKKERDELWRRLINYRATDTVQDYHGSPSSELIFDYIEQMLARREKKD